MEGLARLKPVFRPDGTVTAGNASPLNDGAAALFLADDAGLTSLGGPLGCSGARIIGSLAHELHRRGGGWGLAAICIGVGQGLAVVLKA